MNWKRLFSLLLIGGVPLLAVSCDLSAPRSDADAVDPTRPDGGFTLTSPLLVGIDSVIGGAFGADEGTICSGYSVVLSGFNFSEQLDEHRVEFSAGQSTVQGMPVAVRLDRSSVAPGQPVPSTLEVLVPGGVSTGTIQLFVRGLSAGAVGYDSCPVLYGATIGVLEDQDALEYTPLVGFAQGSRVTIYGLNLGDVQAVVLSDGRGGQEEIPANSFIRTTAVGGGLTGQRPTGYESFGFELNNGDTNVRFPYSNPPDRHNLSIRVRGPAGESNELQLPVITNPAAQTFGIAINSVRVPTGVLTGPVRVHYQAYERVVDASWLINLEWKVEGVTDTPPVVNEIPNSAGWVPAKPRDEDPLHDGDEEVIAGTIFHDDGQRLLPGGGAVRTFVWDAQCDPNFQRLRELGAGGGSSGSAVGFTVKFRIRPELDAGVREFFTHTAETPAIVYVNLEDTQSSDASELRQATLLETFDTDANEARTLTTASWGPPFNPGLIAGDTEPPAVLQFGSGRAVVILENRELDVLPGQGPVVDQFYVINTDRMEITHRVLRDVGGVIVEEVTDVLFTDNGTPEGTVVGNPGRGVDEFHVARFEIRDTDLDEDGTPENTLVVVQGAKPLVIRVAGEGTDPGVFDETCVVEGTLDLSGFQGGDGAEDGTGGAGGAGVAGGGAGGDGASVQIVPAGISVSVRALTLAERGGNFGGGPGATPAALGTDPTRNSLFAGAPGGGGGHRDAGGTGDYGTSNVPDFRDPRAGFGGPARGDDEQVPQTSGSGGGGGGASISLVNVNNAGTPSANGGGGGGGGGGSVRFVVRGSMVVNGTIAANGGNGGSGVATGGAAAGGAGAGGSGGSILCQATGDIRAADCDVFQVRGGEAGQGGNSNGQNRVPGAGRGARGFVRLESALGGTPFCNGVLQAFTTLTSRLRDSRTANTARVASVAGFPESGFIQIGEEVMYYGTRNSADNELDDLVRDEDDRRDHDVGTPVVLLSTVVPRDDDGVLLEDGLTRGPDDIDFGLGRDGVLHLRFIPSANPITGEPLIDEETGEPTSLWTFDTNAGVLRAPNGQAVLTTREATTRPGLLDLVSLRIDEGVVLRAFGDNPLEVIVRDTATIAGTIDVSGFDGGALRFTGDGLRPRSGLGGEPGPGGGRGGLGGTVQHVDGDPRNRDEANTIVSRGQLGGLPTRIALLNAINQNGALGVPVIEPATGGGSLRGRDCGQNCLDSAGGGGGGGCLRAGEPGQIVVIAGDIDDAEQLRGQGGMAIGFDNFRFNGEIFLVGGTGGAGGGASANVSNAYATGSIQGNYAFKADAAYAAGTGGGGGGGICYLAASNVALRAGARLLARGGDAFQSIDLGGNAGAGGGGNIFVRVSRNFTLDPTAVIDVSGGLANRLPPLSGNGLPLYEGNIRPSPSGAPALEGTAFGGLGGHGSAGRIRLETTAGSGIAVGGDNPSVSSGAFLLDVVESVGTSRVLRAGLGPAQSALTHGTRLGSARVIFNTLQQPPGTSAVVLWEGATESLDIHGEPGELSQLVRDPRKLRFHEFVRFRVYFLSNYVNRTTRSVQELGLPIVLDSDCLPGF